MMTTELTQQVTREHTVRRKATLEEFWALPESMLPTEYINGEIIMAPAPTAGHQIVVGNIHFALREFLQKVAIGTVFISPLDVVLPTGEVVQPDAFVITDDESLPAASDKNVRAAPSLAVEILSPGSIKHDTITKRNLYEQNGVREYWIVDPDAKTIAQLVLEGEHYVLTELTENDIIRSAALAGFEMVVRELLGLS
ncbi:MAG TPA: Uma2 family endonuclease [Pyrinomonadaceae bacterium]|jgi:Uma2 family endonuclease